MLINEVMNHIHNHFEIREKARFGIFCIKNGSIDLPFLLEGQYFWIKDSVLNDGVYRYPAYDLADETFDGVIIPLKVDNDFVKLVEEIEKWQEENGSKTTSPLQSESFGGYSYSKSNGANGEMVSWKDAFGSRLKTWRKL